MTLRRKRISVDAGAWLVFGLRSGEVWVGKTDRDASELVRATIEAAEGTEFTSVVPNRFAWVPLQTYLTHQPEFDAALLAATRSLAARCRKPRWQATHSPNIIAYLENELGRIVPRPSFERPSETTPAFESLFDRFLEEYLGNERGKKHLARYGEIRRDAQANWSEVRRLRAIGDDITETVLSGLLPHRDTTFNRERGAWVHIASVINREVKHWFSRAEWATNEQWPRVADAIYEFIDTAVGDPDALETACLRFAETSPARGIQSAFLSPILNALAPESFAIYNRKSRETIGDLAGAEVGSSISDYPNANRIILDFVRGHPAINEEANRRGAIPIDVFDVFSHWYVAIHEREEEAEYWKIAPGEGGRLWQHWLDEGIATIAWDEFGDLTDIDVETFRNLRDRLKTEYKGYTKAAVQQLWRFRNIAEGAYVVANRGTTEVLGIGRVTGHYYFDASAPEHRHRLPVEWFDTTVRKVDQAGWRKTLIELEPEAYEAIVRAEQGVLATEHEASTEEATLARPLLPPYSLDDFVRDTGLDAATVRQWVAAIDRKGQAILYGPPGSGKTYCAERFARHLAGRTDGFVDLVQFHPAYTYEEFIQGIRPRVGSSGVLEYPTVPGRFLDFIAKAQQRGGPAVLIIDEINRANISRVFGELMYLLEYRDRPIPLAGGGTLSIPANVRIIGTMNTADRSIALVDHALRRRFAFLELPTNYDVLEKFHENGAGRRIASVLREVNSQIESHYQIGISYFLHRDIDRHLETIWRTEIEPYLEEYFFDREDTVRRFRWSAIVSRIQP